MVMVHIYNENGIFKRSLEFVIYDLDTQKSAITRLASELKTTPKYLYFLEGLPSLEMFNETNPIIVENLLETISSEEFGLDFVSLVKKLEGKLSQNGLKLRDDVLLPFVAFNKSFDEFDSSHVGMLFLSLSEQIKDANLFGRDHNPTDNEIRNLWEVQRDEITRRLSKNIRAVLEESIEQKKMFEEFNSVKRKIYFTDFEQESAKIEFTLQIKDITIMELFNNIQLSPVVPFACINDFFKILKDFDPPKEWGISISKGIIFKILQKKNLYEVKPEDYAEALLLVNGDPGNEIINVSVSLFTSRNFLPQDEIIDRFLTSIRGMEDEVTVETVKEIRVKGSFYFPLHSLDKYVLADLVMNNPLFSSMMSIDESDKATKKKESIYLHFHNSKIGKLTANLTEKIAERNDPDLRGKDITGKFKFGSTYIRVKIVIAENLKAVSAFQELFSELLSVYDTKYEETIAFYKKYIPDFGSIKKKERSATKKINPQKQSIKDIAPEVFVVGYPQRCSQPPTIIDDEDFEAIEQARKDGKTIMRYPKDGGILKARNYVCNYTDYKHPGLRDNPLENNDILPYLPCCYKKTHDIKDSGNIFRYYYNNEPLREKTNVGQQDLLTTKKFASADKYGTLPDNMNKMFEIFDYDEEYMYIRKGVHVAKSSFLECVMEGMHLKTGILAIEDRESYLAKVRKKLATEANAASCKQEMYDYTTKQIIDIIRDPSVYMDPSLFTSLLEQHFNCNIFVFTRNGDKARLNIPRHDKAYYKNKRKANCIFIYEHSGSPADKEKDTRCELIVKWRKIDKDDVSYYSLYDSKISIGVREIYNRMNQSYALNMEITETIFPSVEKGQFFEQGFDSYGKCRMLRFRFEGFSGTILTDPLQPFVLPEVKNWVATKISKAIAIKFARSINIELTGQCVHNKILKEIYGKIGRVNVIIPVNDSEPISGLEELNDCVCHPTSSSSVLANHNKYKKLARYVTEYMFWLFSKYIVEDVADSQLSEVEMINNFAANKIKIDADFEYGKVGKIFNPNSGVMDMGKLVVKSEETLKRLMYTLRLSLRRFREKIEKYHERKTIENFYLDVTDFDQHPQQVILYGEDSVVKWNQEKNIKHVIHDSIQIDIKIPYFFKNSLVNQRQIYLAQNTSNLKKAIEIGKIWTRSDFNIGDDAIGQEDVSDEFNLYRYLNSDDIVVYRVKGSPNYYNIHIIGYKIDGVSFFTVLLKL
jgi:hypothetical protein